MSGSEQSFDEMGADKAGSAGHQDAHGASVKTKQTSGKGRTFARFALISAAFFAGLAGMLAYRLGPELTRPKKIHPALRIPSPLELASLPLANRFDFPLGSEHGAFAYNAQPFTENRHLGDDLNGIGGENSDFGDPVFAVGNGRVLLARDGGSGWGNVVIVLHAYMEDLERKYVQSYYGHLHELLVAPGQEIRRGDKIGTVGNAGGRYWAHLHLEMREFLTPFIGPGYREDTRGWINPTQFIEQHRGAPEEDVGRPAP